MLSFNKYLVSILTVSGFLLLGACGGDDAETASAPAAPVAQSAPAAEAAPAAASSEEGAAITMDSIEKAEGVVYQDEIYANWPYTETE